MSLNDHKEVRRIFSGFKVEPVSRRYSCMRKITSRGELLINNYSSMAKHPPLPRKAAFISVGFIAFPGSK